jgi:hypothetical protein
MEGFGWIVLGCHAVILLGEPSERRNIRVSFLGDAGGSGKGVQVWKGKGYGAVMRCSGSSFGTFFLFPSIFFFLHRYISTACVIRYPRHSNMADCT